MPRSATFTFTSESVREGHSYKLCDVFCDAIRDAYLALDPYWWVAREALCKCNSLS